MMMMMMVVVIDVKKRFLRFLLFYKNAFFDVFYFCNVFIDKNVSVSKLCS